MGLTIVTGREGALKAAPASEFPEIAESPRFTCALGGAYGAALATFGAVPILHSGLGCGMANAHGMTYAAGLNSGGTAGTTTTPCSGLIEEHVVFGGEDKLRRLIDSTLKVMKGELFVVISGCVPALIGDDVDSVIAEFKDRAPIVHVKTSGFVGNSLVGYNLYLDAIIDGFLSEKKETAKKLVNIFGIVPNQSPYWKGELREIESLLAKIGVKANAIFANFEPLGAIASVPNAALNLVFHPWAGVAAAQKLEERFGTPFINFEHVPVGPQQSADVLRTVGRKLKIPNAKVEKVIGAEEKNVYRYMEFLAEMFMISMPHAFFGVVGDSAATISYTRFGANELGWNPEISVITDDPPEETHASIVARLTQNIQGAFRPQVFFDYDSYRIRERLNEHTLQVLLASSLEKYVRGRDGEAFHLSVAYPIYDRVIVDRSYAGFRGGVALLEDISHSFAGPL
ncbi:MAG: nitrogenase [Deltaproteobacteria bacterium]|jgi:nitrogenase molybdenum-iron protein beta chain|nr:nitrogenase [Deltaproteobacteria bacterium]